MYKGLSLDQAPPIAVPFSFYVAASLMGVASGVVIGYLPDLSDRWHPLMMVLAHSFLLGFVGLVMIGSLFQMLPVVAGVTVVNPALRAAILLVLFSVGMIGLMGGLWAFDWSGWRATVAALLAAVLYFLFIYLGSLLKVRSAAPAVLGMILAGVSLFGAVVLGGLFILSFSGVSLLQAFRPQLTDVHLSWGTAGWMGFLIQGVLCQVIPMFFVTPPFWKNLIRAQMAILFSALLGKSLLVLFGGLSSTALAISDLLIFGSLFLGGAYSLALSFQRKRKVRDLSLHLIRVGLTSIMAALPLVFWAEGPILSAAAFQVIALFGVGSIVLGMLFKIVPFLVWFHLQAQAMDALLSGKNVVIPTMKEIVSDRAIAVQIALHLVSLVGWFWSFWRGTTLLLAMALILSSAFLLGVVARSWWRYVSIARAIRQ